MKKGTKNLILTILLSAAFTLLTCAGIIAVADGNTQAGLSAPLTEKVGVGDTVEIPAFYVEKDGKTVMAQANILFPSGVTYSGTKFTAKEAGRYAVSYSLNGKVLHTEYCTAVLGAEDMFSVNALATVEGIAQYKYAEGDAYKGVAVNVKSGAEITFEHEIDLTKATKEDLLFSAIVEPKTKGETDMKQMILTLSDVEDETNYLKITLTDGNADGGSPKYQVYISAGANGQTAGGYEGDRWLVSDIYGASVLASFRAETYNGLSNHAVKLFYDAGERALYASYYDVDGTMRKVADFDDPVIFQNTVWGGFESGKAKLTVSFREVSVDGGRVIFNEIGGIKLTNTEIVDDEAPTLKIDLGGESKAPNAKLGTQYSVFPYETEDFFDTNVKVSVSVTHENISTGKITDVSVKDGKFLTEKLGKYTIKYVASDYSGNSTEKAISFNCVAQEEDIVITGIGGDFAATAFERVEIPYYEDVRAYGGFGELKLSITAKDPDLEEVALENGGFVPEKLGDYKIIYKVTDYYGTQMTKTLNVAVQANESILFQNDIALPDLLIAGFSYNIPQVFAKTCYGGKVVDCQMDYWVNGTKLENTRTFTASGERMEIECRAYAKGSTKYDSVFKTVMVVDGKNGKDQTAYFYDPSGKVSVAETKETVDLTAKTNGAVEFANMLKGSAFSLGVEYYTNKVTMDAFNVILRDAENADVNVTLRLELKADGVKITTPFGSTADFPVGTVNDEKGELKSFQLKLLCESGLITNADGTAVTYVLQDDAGKEFGGFSSGLYAKMAFEGVRAESTISLSSLNNQSFGYRSDNPEEGADKTAPEIEILGELATKATVGEKVKICAARAYDVLSQVVLLTVRVQAPSKAIVLNDNADKDYEIEVNESGYYKVVYTVKDSAGRQKNETKNIRVVDSVAPTLSVDFADVTKSVGDTVNIPQISVSDDSGVVYYDVFLSFPNTEIRLLTHYDNGNITSYLDEEDKNYPNSFKVSNTAFKVELKGKYTLTVMAYDECYNVTTKSFTITVK